MTPVNSQSRHILVLEDEPIQRELLVTILARAGFRVSSATQVSLALSLVKHEHVDLVITDYYLPDLSGADFVQALRSMDEYRRIPIIMLTARTKELNLQYLRDDMMVFVLQKPADTPALLSIVSKCLAPAGCSS